MRHDAGAPPDLTQDALKRVVGANPPPMLLREGVVIPKLADAELILREPHQDIHCKNVRWTNGIWGPCPSADVGEHESIFSQSGISLLEARLNLLDWLNSFSGTGG